MRGVASNALFHATHRQCGGFDLAELHAHARYLRLCVLATEELHIAVRVPARIVAGAIQAAEAGVHNEAACGVRRVEVAHGHADAADVELA